MLPAAHRGGDRSVLSSCAHLHRSVHPDTLRKQEVTCASTLVKNNHSDVVVLKLTKHAETSSLLPRSALADGAQEGAEAPGEDLLCSAAHHAEEPHGRGHFGQGKPSLSIRP